jgi:protein tyrosine phosphatase (PTP) superfamily phosphohydrolase (DUF442 family)
MRAMAACGPLCRLLLAAAVPLAAAGCEAEPRMPRPADWAQPVADAGEADGVYRVTPGIYRGPRPLGDDYQTLQRLGVRTLLSLQTLHVDRERAEEHGLHYERIPIAVWAPTDQDLIDALRVLRSPDNHPVYVYCNLGIDRTGFVIAAYRVVEQGWTRQQAIDELVEGGYGFWLWQNLVDHLRDMDVDEVRRRVDEPAEENDECRSQNDE